MYRSSWNMTSSHSKIRNSLRNRGALGCGNAIILGCGDTRGDFVVVIITDESDDCSDLLRYQLTRDAVLGSRIVHYGGATDYPTTWL